MSRLTCGYTCDLRSYLICFAAWVKRWVHVPQVQSGTVRYGYMHGIRREDFVDDRRVSITFRMNASAAKGSSSGVAPPGAL